MLRERYRNVLISVCEERGERRRREGEERGRERERVEGEREYMLT
jgi:hypothetical protein